MNRKFLLNPWFQLAVGIVGMVAIANLQYGWNLFVDPLEQRFGWDRASIQIAFTLFVLTETWLVPIEGYLVDRFGPRRLVALGGVLVGLSWILNSQSERLELFYFNSILGGIGAGIVYGTTIGNALKWFTRHRGLAAGLTAAGFGAGSALTIVPIENAIRPDGSGYRDAFFYFGIGQGLVVLVCAWLMRPPAQLASPSAIPNRVPGFDLTVWQVARTPLFWMMYMIIAMVPVGGLMLQAQLKLMAKDYQVAHEPIHLFGITMVALNLALVLDRILSGFSRPFFGWISDHFGRENTMFLAFGLEGVAIFFFIQFADNPVLFVVLSGLTFFAWGEIFSLFPALCGDLFGRKHATANYGLLYTGKGIASLFVPLGNLLHERTKSWQPVFYVAMTFDLLGALAALLILKPWRLRWQQRQTASASGNENPPPVN